MPDGREIERKYLVKAKDLPAILQEGRREDLLQGYVTAARGGNEVRLRNRGGRYFLTVKSRGGLSRWEGEIEISRTQFETLWPFTGQRVVEKIRYRIEHGEATIEVDVYSGRLKGLVTAEVEFASLEESERFVPPPWFDREVTEEWSYKNESLALHGVPE